MEKLRNIILAVILLFGASGTVRAAVLETGGEFRARGWWLDNYLKDGATTDFWDQRLRLEMNLPVAERVSVQVRADILSGMWGDNDQVALLAVTEDPVTGEHRVASTVTGTAPKRTIVFDWANVKFVLPGTPLLVSLGRQDVSWGTGYWVRADNRDRFMVAAKLDPVVIVVAYDKFTEVFLGHDTRDDQRGWAVAAVADAAGAKVGLIAAFLEDDSRTRFAAGDLSYAAGDVFAKGRFGPVAFGVEVNYGGGTIDRGAMGDLDTAGLGAYAGVFLTACPLLTVGLEGAYARGDDPSTPNKIEGFFSADYHGPYHSVIFYNNMDYPGYALDVQTSSPQMDFSVKNAVTGKFSATVTPFAGLSITGAGLYAAADQTRPGVDKAMGWEFDLVAVYDVTENVSVTAGAGYALLGDYWKSAAIAGPGGKKPDNPLAGVVAFTTRF